MNDNIRDFILFVDQRKPSEQDDEDRLETIERAFDKFSLDHNYLLDELLNCGRHDLISRLADLISRLSETIEVHESYIKTPIMRDDVKKGDAAFGASLVHAKKFIWRDKNYNVEDVKLPKKPKNNTPVGWI